MNFVGGDTHFRFPLFFTLCGIPMTSSITPRTCAYSIDVILLGFVKCPATASYAGNDEFWKTCIGGNGEPFFLGRPRGFFTGLPKSYQEVDKYLK